MDSGLKGAGTQGERGAIKWTHLIDQDALKISESEHAGIEQAGHVYPDAAWSAWTFG